MAFKGLGCAVLLAVALAIGDGVWAQAGGDETTVYSPELAALSQRLSDSGRTDVQLVTAELLVAPSGSADKGTVLIANDRTHVFPSTFVENDPRRGSPFNTITYLVDQSDGRVASLTPTNTVVVLPNSVTEPEIDASMAVWAGMNCNGPLVQKVADSGADPDLVDGLINPALWTIGTPFADVTHAGWYPAPFFDALVPGGSNLILAITFTFVFIDTAGNPTDIDRDGRPDTAFREIYYNRTFPWATGSGNAGNIDIQSVSIHESGHGFGLAHFGKVFLKNDGDIQFAPKAIMNAVYVGPDRTIRGSDTASFCQIWASSH